MNPAIFFPAPQPLLDAVAKRVSDDERKARDEQNVKMIAGVALTALLFVALAGKRRR